MNRDFKGVWIPKEIWLNEKLTLLEKIIFVEIDSLDNENHCVAGNEYFATFCNCSESKVSKAIKKLKDLNMIEEVSFDGRHRKIRVVKSIIESSKKYEAESQNLQSNNIDNKQKNKVNKTNSKELVQNFSPFEFGKQKQPKSNMYANCVSIIDDFTQDTQVRVDLTDYLKLLFEMRKDGFAFYANNWKGLLRKLSCLSKDPKEQHEIICQSIERGYKSFFPVISYSGTKEKPWEVGVSSVAYTDEELAELKRIDAEREARGMRTKF